MSKAIKQIETVRAEIRALQREREDLENVGRSRDEVREYVMRQLKAMEAASAAQCTDTLVRLASGERAKLLHADLHVHSVDVGPLLVAMLGVEKVAAVLLARLDSIEDGPSRAQRVARIEAINTQLDDLETREERLIEQAEAEGETVLRRADARPEIVLALPVQ
jgi:hypothetical protein